MKKSIILFILLASFESYSQKSTIDTISFCNKAFTIPSECATPSKFQIFCDEYSMFWFYPAKSMISSTVKTFIKGTKKELDDCSQDSIKVFLLNEKVEAIKLICKVKGALNYQFISYGVVNNQPVVVILNLWKDPRLNEDIPGPIRQIMKLN